MLSNSELDNKINDFLGRKLSQYPEFHFKEKEAGLWSRRHHRVSRLAPHRQILLSQ